MYAFASIFKTLGCAVLSPMPTTGADVKAAQIRLANHRYVLAQSNELLLISQRTAALSAAASRIFHVETQVWCLWLLTVRSRRLIFAITVSIPKELLKQLSELQLCHMKSSFQQRSCRKIQQLSSIQFLFVLFKLSEGGFACFLMSFAVGNLQRRKQHITKKTACN